MSELYNVVCSDPPWKTNDRLPGPSRGAENNYKCLSVQELCKFELPPIADDALLFLWRINSMVEEAYQVCRAWDFVPKTEIVWVKTTDDFMESPDPGELPVGRLHFGMGRYTRASTETCIVASRGRGIRLIKSHSIRNVFFAPTGKHSQKPEKFYDLVEQLAEGPYVEMFARRQRPNWTCLGDELPSVVCAVSA